MLRVRLVSSPASISGSLSSPSGEIVRLFDDPLLELVRLLREAANIEHALLVQYLFASFSIKDRYAEVAGAAVDSGTTLFGVAVQEMRHFARVNELLVKLAAEPSLDREDFPIHSDLYPFTLDLEPLTRASLAKYVAAESPADALNPVTAPNDMERRFREAVNSELGALSVNHIGSLYGTIINRLHEAATANSGLLEDPSSEASVLEQIRSQGETTHFRFFCTLFDGSHPGFKGQDIWQNPQSETYPSYPLLKNPTAFEAAPNTIPDDSARRLAWLTDLHYWAVLGLIYLGHNPVDSSLIGRAISHMLGCLYPIGRALAVRGAGVPFDPLGCNIGLGLDRQTNKRWMLQLLSTIQQTEASLMADLPHEYSKSAAVLTIKMLGAP